jgi:RNA-directed DNA polymerase
MKPYKRNRFPPDITKGIPRGCPLSPLLGAFFLTELDNTLEQQDVFYVRYMDDVLIMSKRRWGLRKAIKRLNEIFSALGLEQHPDKTFIGRIEKGFDFLGYHFSRKGLRLARKTLTNALEKWHRLYEQRKTAPESAVDPGAYWRRWCSWARGGLTQESQNSINALIDELTVSYPSIQSTPT